MRPIEYADKLARSAVTARRSASTSSSSCSVLWHR
jgi:hypothetical protein